MQLCQDMVLCQALIHVLHDLVEEKT